MSLRSPLSTPKANRFDLRSWWLPLFAIALYLFVTAALFLTVVHRTGGHFVYALDDPYIHLALAEGIAHGHYGINLHEPSSPSSSLLWPFLLVPFSSASWNVYLPLAWNLLCGVLTCGLVAWLLLRWVRLDSRPGALFSSGHRAAKLTITAVLLLLVANVETLTFVGMEHLLQVLLSGVCAFGVAEALSLRRVPTVCLFAAVLLPSVRYEGVAITLALALALWGQDRRRAAAVTFAVSLLPLLAFAAFLHLHHLPVVPVSVLVKSNTASAHTNFAVRMVRDFGGNLYGGLSHIEFWPLAFLAVFFAHRAWHEPIRARRYALAGVAALATLQSIVGRHGWFTRYEVYAVLFAVLLLVRLLLETPPIPFGFFAMGLTFCAAPYILSLQNVVSACTAIYNQHFQMHRFLTDYYHGNVAVNDLGMVSYHRPPGTYVLDLWGLASPVAARQNVKDAAWLDRITRQHAVDLAIIYPDWYTSLPADWTPLGALCMMQDPGPVAERCTVLFSTNQAATVSLRAATRSFALTLPRSVTFTPDSTTGAALVTPPPH